LPYNRITILSRRNVLFQKAGEELRINDLHIGLLSFQRKSLFAFDPDVFYRDWNPGNFIGYLIFNFDLNFLNSLKQYKK